MLRGPTGPAVSSVRERLEALCRQRILVLDGATGSLIQGLGLSEAEFRGERYADHDVDLRGNDPVLALTRPDVVASIYDAYFEAGSDIVQTVTFTATSIAQADYRLEDAALDMNRESARLARQACDAWTARTPERPRFVAGSVGPLNKKL